MYQVNSFSKNPLSDLFFFFILYIIILFSATYLHGVKMALDGFSIKQVGFGQDNTSAQMAKATESAIKKGSENKDVETISMSGESKAVTINEDETGKGNRKQNQKDKSQDSEDEVSQNAYIVDVKGAKPRDLQYYTQFSEKLAIRLNKRTEAIELYDKDTKKTVETISASDLVKLIEHLNISSGVLVNKKI